MKRVSTDRSRIITHQRCNRRRWLEYHEGGLGIQSLKTPLPLAVGGSVHEGLAELLRGNSGTGVDWDARALEDHAVAVALADFAQYSNALDLDVMEMDGATLSEADLAALGGDADVTAAIVSQRARSRTEFDEFLVAEQTALVEAMVRAYARRRLRPLLEQFEVLEVEREGSWLLAEWYNSALAENVGGEDKWELRFMSRPDALLRERTTNELYLLSFKTAASWDVRKARDAEHDMQGLSEGIEIERRLAEWWTLLRAPLPISSKPDPAEEIPARTRDYLMELDAPPRIHAIRYEFLLKGDRRRDKDLAARVGFDARSQASVLVRGYLAAGMVAGDEKWCHSWDYLKPDGTGETSKLNYRTYRGTQVWQHMPIRDWIDGLDDSAIAVSGDTGAELGYQSKWQAVGYTATHPLDDVFVPPVVIYRQEDALRDLVDQLEAQERRVAEGVAEVEAATDSAERRHLLNVHFPQSLHSCEWPSTCAFTKICFGGEHIQSDPLNSGLYKPRVPNHPQEISDGAEV